MGDAEGKDRDDQPEPAKYVERILINNNPEKLNVNLVNINLGKMIRYKTD